MTHPELIKELRGIDSLVDVTGGQGDRPNFHLKHKPFLHFHAHPDGGVYADVRLGRPSADFTPVWAATPAEREDLYVVCASTSAVRLVADVRRSLRGRDEPESFGRASEANVQYCFIPVIPLGSGPSEPERALELPERPPAIQDGALQSRDNGDRGRIRPGWFPI